MTTRTTRWISQGFEELIAQKSQRLDNLLDTALDFDIIIVGSGYGGSIAAAELAGLQHDGQALRIAVLERGNEYLSGMFPSRLADLPKHVRFNTSKSTHIQGKKDALFDFRIAPSVNALISNGLGGGSLINAGVMVEAKPHIFDHRWPKDLRYSLNNDVFSTYYPQARSILGIADAKGINSIERHSEHCLSPLSKFTALKNLSGDKPSTDASCFSATPLTIAMEEKTNTAGVALSPCKLCGDCAVGCNHNAKDSLDLNLLVKAHKKGVSIYTGATVLSLSALTQTGQQGWAVSVAHTQSSQQQREGSPTTLTCQKVILAAGTFGSTEILLRSQSPTLAFSSLLGQRFSSNGDMLASLFGQENQVNGTADEEVQPHQRHVGPSITSMIDLRDNPTTPYLIQEMAVPGPLRRLFEEVATTADNIEQLITMDDKEHLSGHPVNDPFSVDENTISHSACYAIMGNDGAQGRLSLAKEYTENSDGALRVRWPELPTQAVFDQQISTLNNLAKQSAVGGRTLANPMWKLLPQSLNEVLSIPKGPLLTVHPLGGCGMGDNYQQGAVDHRGCVFDASSTDTHRIHEGLVVLDGSMIPCALEANPALTISALSLRAIKLLSQHWQYSDQSTRPSANVTTPIRRPIYAETGTVTSDKRTRLEITERLTGAVTLTDNHQQPIDCVIDITLRFQDIPALDFVRKAPRTLTVNSVEKPGEPSSQIRIFHQHTWSQLTQQGVKDSDFDQHALLISQVSGTLDVMSREASFPWQRILRTLWPWLLNRGIRDIWQRAELWFSKPTPRAPLKHANQRKKRPFLVWSHRKMREITALGSRGGEVRLFDYTLALRQPAQGWPVELAGFDNQEQYTTVTGSKRISYTRANNPLRQMEDMYLQRFPGLQPDSVQPKQLPAKLRYDARFLTHHNKPLLRIVEQQDHATALADVAAFLGYFLRGILNIHLRSFREPDTTERPTPNRLPLPIEGTSAPEITELFIGHRSVEEHSNIPVYVRLTRYARKNSNLPPLVLFHGYSASGSTFTHHSLKPSLAQYFWKQGRDIWVVDLRTSSGLATAIYPWSFEEVAVEDIPIAIDHIYHQCQQQPVDIIAHCMGASMLSIAILAPKNEPSETENKRNQLPNRIRKLVLSQVGPRVVFSPENVFRAFFMNYLQRVVPSTSYSFSRSHFPSTVEQQLDRFLSAMPYPRDELLMENPARPWAKTHYTATRHRMDSLYGRTFKLSNISSATLDHIDDLFGPLNIKTLSQVTQFATHEKITNQYGENEFVTTERLMQRWHFPTLSVHGDENGLADVSTLERMQQTMQSAGCEFHSEVLQGFGHQDSIIGKNAKINFEKINNFLKTPLDNHEPQPCRDTQLQLCLPYSGPVIGAPEQQGTLWKLPVSLGVHPSMLHPEFVIFVPIKRNNNTIEITENHILDNIVVKLASPRQQNWIKLSVPLTPALQHADGIIPLILDDQHIHLDDLNIPLELPDNLLDLATGEPLPLTASSDNELSAYLHHTLRGQVFSSTLRKTLNKPWDSIESSIIQYPKHITAKQPSAHFVIAACQYPAGLLDKPLAYQSYQRLANYLDSASTENDAHEPSTITPQFIILMGDQVYTDASAGLFDPTDQYDRYTLPYHKWLSQPHVKSVLRRLPSYMMLDDHEIIDNWDRAELTLGDPSLLEQGKRSYLHFQRNSHQTPRHPAPNHSDTPLWYTFVQQGFDFFMIDSRTEREGRSANEQPDDPNTAPLYKAKILSDEQLNALIQWLDKTNSDRPRFIVSPSMLLPRQLHAKNDENPVHYAALHSDAWDGYPYSLNRILAHIADNNIEQLVFLSGDEHLSNITEINLEHATSKQTTTLYSIHSSGLYSPYQFANSQKAMFAEEETFAIHGKDNYQCQVNTQFFEGDGFALIRAYQTHHEWKIACRFSRSNNTTIEGTFYERTLEFPLRPSPIASSQKNDQSTNSISKPSNNLTAS
ncbi:hypothetical protein A9Q99_17660 [Gammaproteobacteria bacterium 45_16_T64]|nr:hypothetical protein A9Q99_17660 [Gammaproteobacteria bacterium 45_16_T64]